MFPPEHSPRSGRDPYCNGAGARAEWTNAAHRQTPGRRDRTCDLDATPVQYALACSGQDATLAAGFRGATSVYFARIVGLRPTTIGFYGLTLDVGQVLRGTAQTHVTHVVNAQVCAALELGDSGVVALGSVNPFGVGPKDLYNFFFVLGPGHHVNRADVLAALSTAPETDTASNDARANPAGSPPALGLVGLTSVIVMLILQHSRRERLQPPRCSSRGL